MTNNDRLVPLLVVRAATEAIDFYVRAFGATEIDRWINETHGTIAHADLAIDGALFSLTEETRAWNSDAPPSLGGSPVVLQLLVESADAAHERACAAGASVVFPPVDFCGERMSRVRDPFGHLWILRQRGEDLTREEKHERRTAFSASSPSLARAQRAQSPSQNEPSRSTVSFASAVELARRIRDKELSSVELTRHFIDRIERLDGDVNAVVVRDFDRALDAAKGADAALARGNAVGALHGVPVTLKEAFDIAGLATTWGVPSLAGNGATSDSYVAARLRAAGAHFLGKTNVPAMLDDFQTANELFGTTNNPWDPARSPGGSSGGSAAALAAGFTVLEHGSDIGGSIRNPAHYCGVYGHKPTFGIVSPRGHAIPTIPFVPDMAVVGPLARSADDLATALEILAIPNVLTPPRTSTLRGLRVAVWPTDALAPVDDEIAARISEIASRIGARGGIVSDRARPAFDPALYRSTYSALVGAVMGGAASDEVYAANERRALTLDPKDTSRVAAFLRSLVIGHRAWLRLDAERARLRDLWRAFFEQWDVLLCPIMATTALPHDRRSPMTRTVTVNGKEQPYFEQVFWASLATLAYLPATVFPSGRSRAGLPLGLQLIGPENGDRTTIAIARLIADEIGGFVSPAGF